MRRWNEALVTNMLPEHVARHFLGSKKRDEVWSRISLITNSKTHDIYFISLVSYQFQKYVFQLYTFQQWHTSFSHFGWKYQLNECNVEKQNKIEVHEKCLSNAILTNQWGQQPLTFFLPPFLPNVSISQLSDFCPCSNLFELCFCHQIHNKQKNDTTLLMWPVPGVVQPVLRWDWSHVCFDPKLLWLLHRGEHQ